MSRSKNKRLGQSAAPKIKLHFLGAAGAVTGSLNLLEVFDADRVVRILIDVGLHQDNESNNFENRLPAGIRFEDIDNVIFTHAHIDHTGYYPYMHKNGYRGNAIGHQATVDCLKFLLPDSGHVQEQEAAYQNRHNRPTSKNKFQQREAQAGKKQHRRQHGQPMPAPRQKLVTPLYTELDARNCLSTVSGVKYDTVYQLNDKFGQPCNISMKLTDASHILGSAVVTLQIGSGEWMKTVVFTGNIGRSKSPVLRALAPVYDADYIVCESTYGNKLHDKRDRLAALAAEINQAYTRAKKAHPKFGCGAIIIPAFALSRVQDILFDLRTLEAQKRIPVMPVYLDSPTAITATRVHRDHSQVFNEQAAGLVSAGIDPFKTASYHEVKGWEESAKLTQEHLAEPVIIIAPSGMAAGGRVLQHLQSRLPYRRNTVIFVGFQGMGTLGHRLVEPGCAEIKMGGKIVPVYATVRTMSDYSGHADYQEMIAWMRNFRKPPAKIFLVHGDAATLPAFKTHIETALHWNVVIPSKRQCFDLI